MIARLLRRLAVHDGPAIFGAFDGMTVVLGVLFSLTGHPGLILAAAFGVGIAEGIGMAAGQWLSDSDDGFGASLVIGLATFVGTILPALPYAVLPSRWAMVASVGVLAVLAGAITAMRADERGLGRALAETYGVVVVAAVVVFVVEQFAPGGSG